MIIFKMIISIAIIGICTYIGILKAIRLKDREYILREMVTFLELVKNEMNYMLTLLPNAYEVSRQKLNTKLKYAIGQIVVDMLDSNDSNYINASIVKNISSIEGLTDYDKNVIISSLKNMGRSDIEGQMNIIDNSINILNNQINEAKDFKLKNSKLYKTIGAISGTMIVVLFV